MQSVSITSGGERGFEPLGRRNNMDKAAIEKRIEEIEDETHRLEMSYDFLPDKVKDRINELFWEFLRLQKALREEA
jgi:hypothetical protein